LALAALGFVVGAAQAHDGGFVDTFGVQGREQIGFAPGLGISLGFVNFVDLAPQPDGKIVVSATVANTPGGSDDVGVLRLNANGTLDTNFGTQGQTIVGFDGGGTNTDVASSVLLQPNGRIVVCGQASGDPSTNGNDFGIVRLTATGAPDTQFSGDGKATVGFDLGPAGSRNDYAVRCSLQSDGKIVAGGQAQTDTSSARMAIARLNVDGSRDTGFNGSGTATVDFGPTYTAGLAFSVKSMANGDTLAIGGVSNASAQTAWAFARLDGSGQLDSSFGNVGIVLVDSGFPSYQPYEALDAVVLPDNSFVAVGIMALLPDLTNFDYGIFKFTATGALDTSFGSGGGQIVPFDLGGQMGDLAVKVIRDAQGRFLVVGFSAAATVSATTTMVRLNADGSFDSSFGVGGKLVVPSAPPPMVDQGDNGTSIALTTDGSILVGSIASNSASPTGLYAGLVKLVGDTIFDGGFDPE
jgi:uncharacterized delta-60 repeat protein